MRWQDATLCQHLLGMVRELHGVYGSRFQSSQMHYLKSTINRQIYRSPVWALQDSSFWCIIAQVPARTLIQHEGNCLQWKADLWNQFRLHTLVHHDRRAVYQGSLCWGQVLQAQPQLPCPSEWGWEKTSECQFKPIWTTLPEAAKICNELIRCGCTKRCTGRCRCKKSALPCTSLCSCDGECNRD